VGVGPEARASGDADADAADVGEPWTDAASNKKAGPDLRRPTDSLRSITTPIFDAAHAPGSLYGAHVGAFCCHHLGKVDGAVKPVKFISKHETIEIIPSFWPQKKKKKKKKMP
jgi:hypothetical protein